MKKKVLITDPPYSGDGEMAVVKVFRKEKPNYLDDIRDLGYALKRLGSGLFREAYQLKGFPLAVKCPFSNDDGETTFSDQLRHSLKEIKFIEKTLKNPKHKAVWRYLPEFYYVNRKTGLALMPLYHKFTNHNAAYYVANILGDLLSDVTGTGDDIHTGNILLTEGGDPVLIDLGFC